MVIGLEKFKEYFADYSGCYVVIGGTACDHWLSEAGLKPRATDDIDLILIVEALTPEFGGQFWNFIKAGGYTQRERSPDKREYFRFIKPVQDGFPVQLELFSRVPDAFQLPDEAVFTPIHLDDSLSSLSAILLDEAYYTYTLSQSREENGLHLAEPQSLIALKARAFLNLTKAKADSRKIRKHAGDVFRLGTQLTAADRFEPPASIHQDLREFMEAIAPGMPGREMFKELGTPGVTPQNVYDLLLDAYQLR